MRTSFWDPGAVGRLDSFEAESKRSWFTIRETLTAAVGGGRLWVPASVVLGENQLQVLTNEGSLELRPRRLVWTEPNSFRVTGLSRGLAFRRSYLRFKSPEEASRAASIIKQNSVLEVPWVPVEEFPVEFRLLLSARYVVALVYVLFVSLVVGLFLLLALGALGNIGLVAGTVVLIVYVGLPFWAMLVKARRSIQGWIRFQAKYITVRSLDLPIPVYPETIEWKSPQVIVLRGRGISYELSFLTTESLTRAVTRTRTAYPGGPRNSPRELQARCM